MAVYKAKKALEKRWLGEYRKSVDILWYEVVWLNTCLYILERIAAFNFRLYSSEQSVFWNAVADSLYESCIMCAWRIAVDAGQDVLTLPKLKAEVLAHLVNPDAERSVLRKLRQVGFEEKLRDLGEEIRSLRHSRYGHLKSRGLSSAASRQRVATPAPIPIASLRKLADICTSLLKALSFEWQLEPLPWHYSPRGLKGGVPDIDLLLRQIATRSGVVDLPERDPTEWTKVETTLSQFDLSIFNACRREHGLPPIERAD